MTHTRHRLYRFFLFAALATFAPALSAQAELSSEDALHSFWYDAPAKQWSEALPVGNGRIGAMVFGGVEEDRIQLNEDSLWAGEPESQESSIGTPEDLAVIRKMIDEGKYKQASEELPKRFSIGDVIRSYQTLGDLRINWQNTEGEVSNYRRSLDFRTGIAHSTWKRGETTFTQEVFCSHPDEASFVKITADGPGTLDCDLTLDRPLDKNIVTHKTVAESETSLFMSGQIGALP